MKHGWRTISYVIAALLVLSLLPLVDGWFEDWASERQILPSLAIISLSDRAFSEDFIKSKHSLISNYDFIMQNESKIFAEIEKLKKAPLYNSNKNIRILVDQLLQQFVLKKRLADQYRRKHSIVTNSINYLPSAYERRGSALSSERAQVQLAALWAYRYYISPKGDYREMLVQESAKAKKALGGQSKIFDGHIDIVLENSGAVYDIFREFLNVDTKTTINQLYREDMAILTHYTSFSRAFSLATTFLTVIVFAFLSYLLNKRNENEQAVQRELEVQRAHSGNNSKMAALGEMAGQIAHEINTPLGTMVLVSKLLMNKSAAGNLSPQFLNEQLELLVKVSDSIGKIVGSMKNFARSGGHEELTNVYVRQIIDEVKLLCGQKVKNHGAVLHVDLACGFEKVIYCKPFQIVQVLINLLGNSLHALSACEKREVTIRVLEKDGNVRFEVSDTGKGIPFKIRNKIFDAQFTTKPVGEGTGIGLSISRQIIESHQGKLFLDSSASNTTFVFEIPDHYGSERVA